jgi:hypothetical protein
VTSEIAVYLRLGFEHIADVRGYDHILFLVALCAVYEPRRWRQVLILVTAFTVGHSVTLALATLRLIHLDDRLVEFLIPLTILTTAVLNIAGTRPGADGFDETRRARRARYVMALGFGLIHGLGFSNFLRALLGAEANIALPLFAFNVGLELGQICIVLVILLVSFAMVRWVRMRRHDWILVMSGAAAGVALILMVERLAA